MELKKQDFEYCLREFTRGAITIENNAMIAAFYIDEVEPSIYPYEIVKKQDDNDIIGVRQIDLCNVQEGEPVNPDASKIINSYIKKVEDDVTKQIKEMNIVGKDDDDIEDMCDDKVCDILAEKTYWIIMDAYITPMDSNKGNNLSYTITVAPSLKDDDGSTLVDYPPLKLNCSNHTFKLPDSYYKKEDFILQNEEEGYPVDLNALYDYIMGKIGDYINNL